MQNKANNNSIKNVLGITLKLLVISTVTALLLSGVNALTKEKIAANAEEEKRAAISEIFGDGIETALYPGALENVTELYNVSRNGEFIGYAAQVAPLGFGGEMTVMVGVSSDGTIAGVKLISHSETPGLGNRVGEVSHTSKYIGQSADGLSVDAITGSTISSNALLSGVETALSVYETVTESLNGGTK